MMQRCIRLALLLTLWISPAALAQEADFPVLTGRVVDNAELLSQAQERTLTDWLARHEEETTNQVVVVTLPTLQGLEIEDYGYQLGRHWGIGQADHDNGALLIVAPEERKVRIEVGYGLEGALTDAESRIIIDRYLLPAFRSGDFGKGIEDAVPAILAEIGDETFEKSEIAEPSMSVADWLLILYLAGIVFIPVAVIVRDYGHLGTGSLSASWHAFRQLRSMIGSSGRGRHRSRWSSGRSGGGFRGGGGSFGGGGASGSW